MNQRSMVQQKQQQQKQAPEGPKRYAADGAYQADKMGGWPTPDEVARMAYFSYLNTGSLPGHDIQHWLEAEAHLLARRNLTRTHGFHNHT